MTAGSTGPVCVAVSGGSDSLFLLHIASNWARRAGRELVVLTVDHGLRAEARAEAEWVAGVARELGHPAQILSWSPDKKSQNAARAARHTLLAHAAREADASVLLLGHTLTDVMETLLIRLARPSALTGAVGPQPVSVSPVWPEGRGLTLARPLIGCGRADLRGRLADAGQSWVDDPSNESDAYERVRVRRLIEGLCQRRLEAITYDAMRLRALEDWRLSRLLRAWVGVDETGLIEVSLREAPTSSPVFSRFLDTLIQIASGRSRSVQASSIEALGLEIGMGGPSGRITLGGAWLQRRGDRLMIGRDPGEMRAVWEGDLWDGRYVRGGADPAPEAAPFLVRHGLPDAPSSEILSARIAHWASALKRGAELAMQIVELEGEASPSSGAPPTRRRG